MPATLPTRQLGIMAGLVGNFNLIGDMKMSNLGLGVMINMLGGNSDTVEAIQSMIDKELVELRLENDELFLSAVDGSKIKIWDDGQSCCESRYMQTDDNLPDYIGGIFLGAEIKEAPSVETEYGDHEIQFLEIKTSKGSVTFATHNEHNGYYGGFYIKAEKIEA